VGDLTPDRIARLRALAAKATPGPWFFDGYSRVVSKSLAASYDEMSFPDCVIPNWKTSCAESPRSCHGCPFFEQDYRADPIVFKVQAHHGDTAIDQRVKDAEYGAAASPDVVLGLLDEIERLKSIVTALAAQDVPMDESIDCLACPSSYRDAQPDRGYEWWTEPSNHDPTCPWRMAREAGHG
jgi:hypothetical protein